MVAEKPSIAKDLAKALCTRGQANERKGIGTSVHEYSGDFYGEPANFKITSCTGHVYETDFPPEYQNWDKTDPSTLFNAKIVRKPCRGSMPKHFAVEAKGCKYLVLWLDCDREGENICFEVMQTAVPALAKHSGIQQVWRAKFSSLAAVDLKYAMNHLGSPDENLSLSVEARQELDLKVGVAFTRFQTRYFQGKYADLDSTCVSYGPCQTPTLWFCVRRHDEIATFQPENYYVIDSYISKIGRDLDLDWSRGQVFDQTAAFVFRDNIVDAGTVKVTDVEQKSDKLTRPQALNTVAMLKMASSQLGIGPQQAMRTAEGLYLRGFLTYPRTETNCYPKNFDLKGAVAAQQSSRNYGDIAKNLIMTGLNKARDGHDAGDHPPITPVRAATETEIGGGCDWQLFDMVCRHFLATVSPDCKFLRTKVRLSGGGEEFTLTGRKVIDPGFTAVSRSGDMADVSIPDFKVRFY